MKVRKNLKALILLLGLILLMLIIFSYNSGKMELTSNAFENGGVIPNKYTCDGENISPSLAISGIPEGTQSLVLIMDDPDSVRSVGKVWSHWVVFNIPPDITGIPEGEEPAGVQGNTSFGKSGYGGPCPHDGEHSYLFKLYALDSVLDLKEGAMKENVEEAMQGHIIERAQLDGRYSRQQ